MEIGRSQWWQARAPGGMARVGGVPNCGDDGAAGSSIGTDGVPARPALANARIAASLLAAGDMGAVSISRLASSARGSTAGIEASGSMMTWEMDGWTSPGMAGTPWSAVARGGAG
ncbi:MAG TPA: hypothetical protein VM305_07485 [Candidatus Limnocylindrales bacterium]|nr:hypothetical protein [Candidatus Limnocylindrales bacterium]